MSEKINWTHIVAGGSPDEMNRRARSEIKDCINAYGCLPIVEIYLHVANGGRVVLDSIHKDESIRMDPSVLGTYRLKVKRHLDEKDAWRVSQPGDTFWHNAGCKNIAYNGVRMSNSLFNESKELSEERGDEYDPFDWKSYTIDEDGCIACGFFVACEILLQFSKAGGRKVSKENHIVEQVIVAKPANQNQPKPGRPPKASASSM
jgi:hypothetical protein